MGVFAIDYNVDFSTPSDYSVSDLTQSYVNFWLAQLNQQLSHTGNIVDGGSTILSWATDIVVEGSYAYVTSYLWDAVEIINVSNPANPTHISSIVNNGTTIKLDGASNIIKEGNYLYVSAYLSDALQIIDVSNPASPTAVWQLSKSITQLLNGISGMTKVWNYLYVASYVDDSLSIIDVSTPSNPTYVGSKQNHTTLNGARNVKVVGNYAYVTAYDSDRFTVLDISNPASPQIITNLRDNGSNIILNGAWGMEVIGNYIYVWAYLSDTIQVINISNPTNPIPVTNITTATGSYQINRILGMTYLNGYLYTAWYTSDAVSIIDVRNPEIPVFVNSIKHSASNPLLNGVKSLVKIWKLIYAVSYVSAAMEVLETSYSSNDPYVENTNGIAYSGGIYQIIDTLWIGNQGNVRYQISNDNGTTWYYYNGSSWASTSASYSQANTITTLNANLKSFFFLSGTNVFKVRAFLNSDSTQAVELDNIEFDTDVSAPTIDSYSPQDNLLFPNGNFNISIAHSDTESGINSSTRWLTLSRWNGSTWWSDIASSYVNFAGTIVNQTGANFPVTNLPYGKYKATYSIGDNFGNMASQDIIFYVDQVEFNISTGSIDMGTLPFGSPQFSTWELLLTVKTVWAGFQVNMTHSNPFTYDYGVIPDWNGTQWFWFDAFPYSWTIQTINTWTTIVSQTWSLNTDGNQNTYVYRIKYWALVDQNQLAWDYSTNVSFDVVYNFTSNGVCTIDQTPFSCIAQ